MSNVCDSGSARLFRRAGTAVSTQCRITRALLLSLLVLLGGCGGDTPGSAVREEPSRTVPGRDPPPLTGDWVLESYAQRLQATRDPAAALETTDPETPVLLRISDAPGGLQWLAVLNFHEGVWATVRELAPGEPGEGELVVFERPFEGELLQGVHHVERRVGDPDRLIWTVRQGERSLRLPLRRAQPTVERWASAAALEGRYAGAGGRPVEFGADGRLHLDGSFYRYRVQLDMVGVECPYFEAEPESSEASTPLRFGFRRDGERLLLFDAGPPEDPVVSCEGSPVMVLTPR